MFKGKAGLLYYARVGNLEEVMFEPGLERQNLGGGMEERIKSELASQMEGPV